MQHRVPNRKENWYTKMAEAETQALWKSLKLWAFIVIVLYKGNGSCGRRSGIPYCDNISVWVKYAICSLAPCLRLKGMSQMLIGFYRFIHSWEEEYIHTNCFFTGVAQPKGIRKLLCFEFTQIDYNTNLNIYMLPLLSQEISPIWRVLFTHNISK